VRVEGLAPPLPVGIVAVPPAEEACVLPPAFGPACDSGPVTTPAVPPCGGGVETTTSGGVTKVPSVSRFQVLLLS
jgi:hypothetical protein